MQPSRKKDSRTNESTLQTRINQHYFAKKANFLLFEPSFNLTKYFGIVRLSDKREKIRLYLSSFGGLF